MSVCEAFTLGDQQYRLPGIGAYMATAIAQGKPSAMIAGIVDTAFNGYLRNREPRATVDSVRMARKKMWASSAKAEGELGYRPQPVDPALRRAVEWFTRHQYAPASVPQLSQAGAA